MGIGPHQGQSPHVQKGRRECPGVGSGPCPPAAQAWVIHRPACFGRPRLARVRLVGIATRPSSCRTAVPEAWHNPPSAPPCAGAPPGTAGFRFCGTAGLEPERCPRRAARKRTGQELPARGLDPRQEVAELVAEGAVTDSPAENAVGLAGADPFGPGHRVELLPGRGLAQVLPQPGQGSQAPGDRGAAHSMPISFSHAHRQSRAHAGRQGFWRRL